MFDRLIESRPARRRPLGQSLASIALHAALGVGVIRATRGVAEPARPVDRDPNIIYVPVMPRDAPVPRASEPSAPVSSPPDGFTTPAPAVVIPEGLFPPVPIQPIEPGRFNPREWRPASSPPVGGQAVDSGMFRLEEVDDPVSVLDQKRPVYPPALQVAGISGSVDVQFVVDTVGRAEATSWRVVGSTNPAFEGPARDAIMASRFQPARIRGRVVRQLVSQRISFTVGR